MKRRQQKGSNHAAGNLVRRAGGWKGECISLQAGTKERGKREKNEEGKSECGFPNLTSGAEQKVAEDKRMLVCDARGCSCCQPCYERQATG